MMPDLIALATFLAIVLLTLGLAGVFSGRRPAPDPDDTRRRPETLWDPAIFGIGIGNGHGCRNGGGPPGACVRLLGALIPQWPVEARRLTLELGHAGSYRRSARIEFLALRNGLALAVLIVAGMMAAAAVDREELAVQILLAGLVVTLLAYSVPRLRLQSAGRARRLRIQRGLPDALELTAMCMAGGLSFQDALERVARDLRSWHPDLATELQIVRRHIELGSLEQAFRQLAARLDLPELSSMTTLIVQSERFGTNLVAPLDVFAADLRRARRQRANAQSNAAGVQMLPPMVLCLLPAAMLLLWGPAVLELRDFWRRERQPGGALSIPGDLSAPNAPAEAAEPDRAALASIGPSPVS